ncbi:MAG: hypothetical protein Q9191_001658 [Dirinaria sp. TL-2023a]
MAPATAQQPTASPADELDEIFNYDVDDVFRDVNMDMGAPARDNNETQAASNTNGDVLGIDEQIKVTKKRAPIPKLDEDKLLSQAGIPKLRRNAREKLRFKGKGHEYSDAARLLQFYQLWLDELYPRAKFADGLAMIEKLGHKKRMQTMRREWINEGKPRQSMQDSESDGQADRGLGPLLESEQPVNPADGDERPRTPPVHHSHDDLYSATPQATRQTTQQRGVTTGEEGLFLSDEEESGQPSGDELDALLAENGLNEATGSASVTSASNAKEAIVRQQDHFDDDMEAMAAIDDMW